MSYILDALKRADAERNKSVPGANLSGPQSLSPSSGAGGRRLPQGLLLGAVSLVVLAGLSARWLHKDSLEQAVIAPVVASAVAPAAGPSPVDVPPASPQTRVPSAPPTNTPPIATKPFVGPTQSSAPVLTPPPAPPQGLGRPQAQAPEQPATPTLLPMQGRAIAAREASPGDEASDATGTMAPGAAPAPMAGVPAATPPPAFPPAPAAAPLPITQPQPQPTRTVPPAAGPIGALASDVGLKVTGATYSENPAHRLLIVNGKVVKEGQEVEPGLVLEVISPRSAVFKRQGTRFNVNY